MRRKQTASCFLLFNGSTRVFDPVRRHPGLDGGSNGSWKHNRNDKKAEKAFSTFFIAHVALPASTVIPKLDEYSVVGYGWSSTRVLLRRLFWKRSVEPFTACSLTAFFSLFYKGGGYNFSSELRRGRGKQSAPRRKQKGTTVRPPRVLWGPDGGSNPRRYAQGYTPVRSEHLARRNMAKSPAFPTSDANVVLLKGTRCKVTENGLNSTVKQCAFVRRPRKSRSGRRRPPRNRLYARIRRVKSADLKTGWNCELDGVETV